MGPPRWMRARSTRSPRSRGRSPSAAPAAPVLADCLEHPRAPTPLVAEQSLPSTPCPLLFRVASPRACSPRRPQVPRIAAEQATGWPRPAGRTQAPSAAVVLLPAARRPSSTTRPPCRRVHGAAVVRRVVLRELRLCSIPLAFRVLRPRHKASYEGSVEWSRRAPPGSRPPSLGLQVRGECWVRQGRPVNDASAHHRSRRASSRSPAAAPPLAHGLRDGRLESCGSPRDGCRTRTRRSGGRQPQTRRRSGRTMPSLGPRGSGKQTCWPSTPLPRSYRKRANWRET